MIFTSIYGHMWVLVKIGHTEHYTWRAPCHCDDWSFLCGVLCEVRTVEGEADSL